MPPATRSVPRQPVAARTADPIEPLIVACCLRCSKRIDKFAGVNDCDVDRFGTKDCGYCRSQHHPCLQIPSEFNRVVNNLLGRKLDISESVPNNGAERELETACKTYKKEVEAFIRVQKKGPGTRAPRTSDEFMPQFYTLFERFVEAQEQLLDLQRATSGLAPRIQRAEVQRAAFAWRVELTPLEPEEENGEQGEGAGDAAPA